LETGKDALEFLVESRLHFRRQRAITAQTRREDFFDLRASVRDRGGKPARARVNRGINDNFILNASSLFPKSVNEPAKFRCLLWSDIFLEFVQIPARTFKPAEHLFARSLHTPDDRRDHPPVIFTESQFSRILRQAIPP
jgi:hypothetical protein